MVQFVGQIASDNTGKHFTVLVSSVGNSIDVNVLQVVGEALSREEDAEVQQHNADVCSVGPEHSVDSLLKLLSKESFGTVCEAASHYHVDHIKRANSALKLILEQQNVVILGRRQLNLLLEHASVDAEYSCVLLGTEWLDYFVVR